MKKAQVSYTKYVIISLVFIVLFLTFLGTKFAPTAKNQARLTACITTIEANANSRISGVDFSQNIKCPAKDLTIDEKEELKIKSTIAKEMAECWSTYKEGQKELFTGEGMFCAICSRIDFDDKDENIEGFSKYLATTKMQNSKKTYLEYLTRYSTDDAQRVIEEVETSNYNLEKESFPTSENYAVIFIQAKGQNSMKQLGKFLTRETTAGEIGTVAAGIGVGTGGVAGGLIALAIGSNPVGWVAGGAIAVGTGILAIAYYFDPTNIPELSSIVAYSDYTQNSLKNMGCEYLPVEQS